MATTQPTVVPALVSPDFDSFAVRQAIAGFLAGYGATTREAYGLDLRQWLGWCSAHDVRLFEVKRAHIELFARTLEQDGKARATVSRRLSTIAGFYRYCVEEQLISVSPAVHLRRPKLNYESNAVGLDRNELGMFLVQAGLAGGKDHALACLLALNGLRISEALNADIERLGMQRGHRTLTITRKGGKVVVIPLAPRTARAIDLSVGERDEGPIFLNRDGDRRLDRHAATRIVKRLARRAGIDKPISPQSLRHSFITAALDAGVALRDVQEAASHADPRTTMRYDRARQSLDRHATYIVARGLANSAARCRALCAVTRITFELPSARTRLLAALKAGPTPAPVSRQEVTSLAKAHGGEGSPSQITASWEVPFDVPAATRREPQVANEKM